MTKTCCMKEHETPHCPYCGRCLCVTPLDWLEKYLVAAITVSRRGLLVATEAGASAQRLDGRKASIAERVDALTALRELRAASEAKA